MEREAQASRYIRGGVALKADDLVPSDVFEPWEQEEPKR